MTVARQERTASGQPSRLSILVTGGTRLMVDALATLLDSRPEFTASSAYLDDLMGNHPPSQVDVVLLDVNECPLMTLTDAVGRLRSMLPAATLVLLVPSSAACWDELAHDLRMGPFLTWQMHGQEAVDAVHRLAGGLDSCNAAKRRREPGRSPLTAREREILWLLAEGQPVPSIAEALAISPRTVDTHLQNLMEKLHARSRRDAVSEARRLGLLPERLINQTDLPDA